MQWQYVVFGMVPAAAYAVLESRAPLRTAVLVASGVAALEFVLCSSLLGLVDPFSLASLVLFAGLGGLALHRKEARLVRLQPVILEIGMGLVFLVAFFGFGKPLFADLLERYVGVLDVIPPFQRGYFAGYFQTMSASVPFLLFLHAGLVAWAAKRKSVVPWIVIRSIGLHALLTLLFFAERLLIEPE